MRRREHAQLELEQQQRVCEHVGLGRAQLREPPACNIQHTHNVRDTLCNYSWARSAITAMARQRRHCGTVWRAGDRSVQTGRREAAVSTRMSEPLPVIE
jgi:hypothetical protein